MTWTNKLAVDGTIAVVSQINATPPNITMLTSGGNLTLSWPPDRTGWRLEVQTNSLAVGLGTNWFTVPGSSGTNQVSLPLDPTTGSRFYRLVHP